jgi:hydroxymethylbilane synthase
MRIRIGTRGSQLALWQARTVSELLSGHDLVCEIVTIKTSGDRLQDAPLSEAGGKRLFVKEIEDALLDGRADIAVHSAKDMPVLSPAELEIAAVLTREEPWDAVVLPTSPDDKSLPVAATEVGGTRSASARIGSSGAATGSAPPFSSSGGIVQASEGSVLQRLASESRLTIGTSSIRRVAQLTRLFPRATFAPIRGNLDTRLRKLDEGQYDALVLAAAGLKRLGAGGRISARLPLEACLPAPGQGAIAVQIRAKDEAVRARVLAINDVDTAAALSAERACVVALGGGCQMPIGALAQVINTDTLDMRALVIAPDGSQVVRTQTSGPLSDPESTGRRAAEDLLAQGAREILANL